MEFKAKILYLLLQLHARLMRVKEREVVSQNWKVIAQIAQQVKKTVLGQQVYCKNSLSRESREVMGADIAHIKNKSHENFRKIPNSL